MTVTASRKPLKDVSSKMNNPAAVLVYHILHEPDERKVIINCKAVDGATSH